MNEKRELASHKKRESTDLVCLIIFVIFTVVLLITGLFCYFQGSVTKLNVPYDPDGKGCGLDYPNYKYIYFPSPQYDSLWVTTCVSQCPSATSTTVNCQTNSVVTGCIQNNSVDNTKAFHVYGTTVSRGSICLPNDPIIRQKVITAIGAHSLQEMFHSAITDWSLFLLMIPIIMAMIVGALVLIRLTAGYVVYLLYAIAIACFIGFGVYLALPPSQHSETFVLKKNRIVSIILSVVSFAIATVILIVFCSYKAKIKAAVKFIDQSNQFFKDNYTLLILPFVLLGFLVLFIIFWIFITVSFYSMSSATVQPKQLPFEHYKLTAPIMGGLIANIFYLIWAIFLLMHTGNFIVSGTVVNWQYSREKPYLNSSKSYFSSHIGSTCLGSFLTVLLGLFKIELDEADCAQRQQQKEKERKCIDLLKGCYACFCCCCVNFIFKCFHHASYVYQNLTGITYCQSSAEIYQVIRQQKQQWSIIAFLYMIFDQFIPLTFTGVSIFIANSFINAFQLYKTSTQNRLLVLIIVAIIAYAISQFFIGIYSETIQSLFVIQQFHKNLQKNKEDYILHLPIDFKQEKSERPQKSQKSNNMTPRYSLFPKNNN